jgi:hypothetical protein
MKLSTCASNIPLDACQGDNSQWDTAIIDADSEIQIAEEQVRRLRYTIRRLKYASRVFKENKREGIPWPIPSEETSCAGE